MIPSKSIDWKPKQDGLASRMRTTSATTSTPLTDLPRLLLKWATDPTLWSNFPVSFRLLGRQVWIRFGMNVTTLPRLTSTPQGQGKVRSSACCLLLNNASHNTAFTTSIPSPASRRISCLRPATFSYTRTRPPAQRRFPSYMQTARGSSAGMVCPRHLSTLVGLVGAMGSREYCGLNLPRAACVGDIR